MADRHAVRISAWTDGEQEYVVEYFADEFRHALAHSMWGHVPRELLALAEIIADSPGKDWGSPIESMAEVEANFLAAAEDYVSAWEQHDKELDAQLRKD